jgi:hypothetical protein
MLIAFEARAVSRAPLRAERALSSALLAAAEQCRHGSPLRGDGAPPYNSSLTQLKPPPAIERTIDMNRIIAESPRPLIGTLLYALLLVAILVVPVSRPHTRRSYLGEFPQSITRRLVIDVTANVILFARWAGGSTASPVASACALRWSP